MWAESTHDSLDIGDKRRPESTHSWPYLSPTGSLTSYLTLLQRFRFCGDLDCPDWVLAEISTLAKIVKCLVYLGLGGERPEGGRRRLGLGAGGGLGWWRSLPEAGASMLCDLGHVTGPPSTNPPVMRGKVGQSG